MRPRIRSVSGSNEGSLTVGGRYNAGVRRVRFLVVFLILLVIFEVLLLVPAVDQFVIAPFTASLATAASVVLNAMGEGVHVTGTVIAGHCFAVDLKTGCNGIEATLFLVAAVIAFPAARLRDRALVAIAGAGALQAVNFVRIASLYLLGCYQRRWFDAFHLAIWQSIIFALAVAMFVAWTRRVTAVHAR